MLFKIRILRPLVAVALLGLLWVATPMSEPARRFIKLENVAENYALIFLTLIFILLIWLQPKLDQLTWMKVVPFALFLGHLLSVVALTVAELAAPEGFDRLSSTLRTAGISDALFIQSVFPAVLLGWLMGLIAASLVKATGRYVYGTKLTEQNQP